MKIIQNNIVQIEEDDSIQSIINWIENHTTMTHVNRDGDSWIYTIQVGDILIFGSRVSIYQFPLESLK